MSDNQQVDKNREEKAMKMLIGLFCFAVMMVIGNAVFAQPQPPVPQAPAPAPAVAPAPAPAPVVPAPAPAPAIPQLPPQQPATVRGTAKRSAKVGEDGTVTEDASYDVQVDGTVGSVNLPSLTQVQRPTKSSFWTWFAWVLAGVLFAASILFLVLFLMKGGKEVDVKTAPAPAPVTSENDDSLAAEANTRAMNAQDTADKAWDKAVSAQDTANTALTVAGGFAGMHKPETFEQCVQRVIHDPLLEEKRVELKTRGLLNDEQIKANAESACSDIGK